jgi:hypothetical protein
MGELGVNSVVSEKYLVLCAGLTCRSFYGDVQW